MLNKQVNFTLTVSSFKQNELLSFKILTQLKL